MDASSLLTKCTTQPEIRLVLDKKVITHVHSVTDAFQYHTRAIDLTMIVAVNKLTPEQAALTTKNYKNATCYQIIPTPT